MKPDIHLKRGIIEFVEGVDYELSYNEIKEQGEYDVTIIGKGNLKGTRTVKVKVEGIDLSVCDVSVVSFIMDDPKSLSALVQPVVTYNGKTLEYNREFFCDFEGCDKSYGKHTYRIYGGNDYRGETKGVYYAQYDLSNFNLSYEVPTYTGKPIEPIFFLKGDGIVSVSKDRFDVKFENNINAGTGKVTIHGISTYYCDKTFDFTIKPAHIKNCKINYDKSVFYNGEDPAVPNVELFFNSVLLKPGDDYVIECSNNTSAGTATLKITGYRNFCGSVEYKYKVTTNDVPTTQPAGAPSATSNPTPHTDSGKPASPDSGSSILEFVERIYRFVLEREPEAEGAAYWSDELYSFRRTGAEVAQGFIFSAEFENRNTTNEEFVTILYKTFFGRDPENEGMAFWLDQLATGTMDRITVANGFIYSQEWADTCASYGIRSGGDIKPAGTIEPTDLTYAFVERMYTTAMGRGYDEEGRQYWASELANFNITGELCGASFFLSAEMEGYNLSDQEFLSRLYATFMNREPDADGESYWLGVMASGAARTDVVFGFTRSPEFTDKCVEARILPF